MEIKLLIFVIEYGQFIILITKINWTRERYFIYVDYCI